MLYLYLCLFGGKNKNTLSESRDAITRCGRYWGGEGVLSPTVIVALLFNNNIILWIFFKKKKKKRETREKKKIIVVVVWLTSSRNG